MRPLFLTLSCLLACLAAQGQLIITGAFDGPLSGGTPKMIEFYATDDIADLSLYGFGSANNGGGTDSIEFSFPAITVQRGDFLYLTDNSGAQNFLDYFGFRPTFIDPGFAASINGDDALELFLNGVVIDVFGDINVDGTGEPWEYLDGWAYRLDATGPDGSTFVLNNWTYSGPNATDGETSNATAASPFPFGTYSQIVVDGTASSIYLPAYCLQDNATGFGDNTNASDSLSTGSELNGAHAVIDGGTLYLMLTGNLETNFNKIDLFIDAVPGGQNKLQGNNPDVDFNGLNRMGDDGSGNGMTFDPGFESDYFYTLTNGVGGGGAVESFVSTAPTDGSGGNGTFLGGGPGLIQSLGSGHVSGINNSNVAGVDGSNVNNPGAVLTGIELAIPLSEIGNPTGPVKITAMVINGGHDFLANQVLCGLGGGVGNLGDPRNVDFNTYAGNQYFELCAGVDGGFVSTANGTFQEAICTGVSPDVIAFDSATTAAASYTYVITDPSGIILAVPSGDVIDFATVGTGTFLVWGLSYTGNLTAAIGDDATSVALTDECFDLSSDYVTVRRDTVAAGMVMTEAGEDTAQVCLNGGTVLRFDSVGAASANFLYVVTDTDTKILGVSTNGSVDFAGAGEGECWVWGLSYTGNLLVTVGDTVATAPALSDDCFDLSDAYVVVNRDSVDGGTVIAASDSIFLCLTDGSETVVSFDSSGTYGGTFTYVVTDTDTEILGLPTGDEVDFAGAGGGVCYVWGLSFTGDVLVSVGDIAAGNPLSDGCFDLSDDYVVVVRDTAGGSCPVSIRSAQAFGEVVLFPVPAQDQLLLRFHSGSLDQLETQLRLFSPSGQLIRQTTHGHGLGSQQEVALPVASLPAGVYLLQLHNGDRMLTRRFVKQ
jgi:hypothetical protein